MDKCGKLYEMYKKVRHNRTLVITTQEIVTYGRGMGIIINEIAIIF